MAKNIGKKEIPNVVQDSSLIKLPEGMLTLQSIDTLSKAEAAFPPGEKPRDEYPPSTPLRPSDDEYHMAHRYRGKVIIFNHFKYDTNLDLPERLGTDVDRDAVEDTFKKIGFSINVKDDLTRAEIINVLNTESTNQHMYIADCLVVVVLTHGGEDNYLYARDAQYKVSELWTPFLADQCPYLATKPKIFIIQACRGRKASRKVDVNTRGPTVTTDTSKIEPEHVHVENYSIPAEADILIAFSSFEGRVAHRDTEKGTWYISELCDELNANWQTDDLMTMLTRVNRNVAINKEHSAVKQMPSIQSTLTRKIYFQNKKPENNEKTISELIKKVDHLITMGEKTRTRTLSCQSNSTETRRDRDLTRESGTNGWNELRSVIDSQSDMPNEEIILNVSKGLRLFLKDRNLKDEINENGSVILALLSYWNILDCDTRQLAYGRLISFMQTHAVQWPYYELLNIPGKYSEERRSRRSSRCSTPTQIHPKPKPPFK